MANLLDYVARVADNDWAEYPLNELDVACLNELAYLPYKERLSAGIDWQNYHDLKELIARQAEDAPVPTYDFLVTKDRLALLSAVLSSNRFAGLTVGHYVNDVNLEYERQFAAMVMQLPKIGYRQLIFRGTDDSLIGWKEDFNMSYRRTIPAQEAAEVYLRQFLNQEPGPVVVSGHSKGGNLAVYAASHLPLALQDHISSLYVFDAPGLHASITASEGYQRLLERIKALRPYEAVVGMMLGASLAYDTVASRQTGLLQHNMLNWLIEETNFQRLSQLSPLSLSLEKTFSEWIDQRSIGELKLFFDTFFDVFFESGIDSLNDLSHPASGLTKAIWDSLGQLSKRQREVMLEAISELVMIYHKHMRDLAKQERLERFEAWGNKLQAQWDRLGFDGEGASAPTLDKDS